MTIATPDEPDLEPPTEPMIPDSGPETGPLPLAPSHPMTRPETD